MVWLFLKNLKSGGSKADSKTNKGTSSEAIDDLTLQRLLNQKLQEFGVANDDDKEGKKIST